NMVDTYVTLGAYLALTYGAGAALGFSPVGYISHSTGGMGTLPFLIGMRSLRRLPLKIKRDLEKSESPRAKKLLEKCGNFKKSCLRGAAYVESSLDTVREYSEMKKGLKKGLTKAGVYLAKKMPQPKEKKEGRISKAFGRADLRFNKMTGNRWSSVKKSFMDKMRIYNDIFATGLIPIPKSDYVLDIYWQVSNKTIKRKFTPEKVKDSFDEIFDSLERVGVEKDLIEECKAHKADIEILNPKELGVAGRGLMRLVPKYIFNEVYTPFKRGD
ncbi:MAG: hypothetical protein HZB68_00715, partial [Candidatus Aenigmarchaeota archaeon]|nr:hypothetical protein [Candidatus Aenigmarchaeota archaeon]